MSDSWRDELVTKGAAFKVVENKMESLLKQFGYDSYEEANEKIRLAYDGMMDALTTIYDMPPSVQQNDIQVAATNYVNGFTDGYNAGKRDAQPPQWTKGKWIVTAEFEDCRYAKCNRCKATQVFYWNKPLTNFCPNCGAWMGGESEPKDGSL